MISLQTLIQALPDRVVLAGGLDRSIAGIQYDSRQVQPGSLFVCVPGFKTDGHLYAADAVAKGAVALVVERPVTVPDGVTVIQVPDARLALAGLAACFYGYPSRRFHLIGVTGTNGKTSTTILLDAVFRRWGRKTGLLGTISNRVGGEVIPASHTTPESLDLQKLFKLMADAQTDYVMMEVSSHALSLHRVAAAEFDVGVFTNLTRDHLDFHRDFQEYREAKGKLFTLLSGGAKAGRKYGVVNKDDPNSEYFMKTSPVPVLTYSLTQPSDYQATDIVITAKGASFRLKGKDFPPFTLNLTGRFSVYNGLAAVAVALEEGVPVDIIREALAELPGVPGRFERVDAGQDFTVVVDYAHTPDGLENVLRTAREVCSGRIITVFGCGGDRDRTKRPLMGHVSGRLSDYTIVTSDNPRTEDPEAIIAEIVPGVKEAGGKYEIVVERKAAIQKALTLAGAGDLVLVAGKGHEDYQIIGTKKYPFDDRKVVREILESMKDETK
ncbi:MAG TPA: UDP-N-acetylmuramoyl-L-alanyl-D-glutamate--2,6-diaminopimelate ligase [Clostridia bacterium]|nr:UDP-N-acetylmuramoyl-L-alanyl-D-glutamate--2,6-diaminopimelate ligase [Clostridia bacterium]